MTGVGGQIRETEKEKKSSGETANLACGQGKKRKGGTKAERRGWGFSTRRIEPPENGTKNRQLKLKGTRATL